MTENVTGKLFAPIHPGESLREDFMEPLGITTYRLAQATGMSSTHISEIIRGKRSITTWAALRLSRALGLSEMYWINAQAHYDLQVALEAHAGELDQVRVLIDA